MTPNDDKTGVVFNVENDVPVRGGNPAQRREYDKRISDGTMSKAGAKCPCCGTIMTMGDIRTEASIQKTDYQLMALAIQGIKTKEYRVATKHEIEVANSTSKQAADRISELDRVSVNEAFDPVSTRSISAQIYGIRKWADLFTERQILSIATIGLSIQKAYEIIKEMKYHDVWVESISDSLCLSLDRLLCFLCVNSCWKPDADSLNWAFSRFSISLLWDFAEAQPLGTSAGAFIRCNERIATAYDTLLNSMENPGSVEVFNTSAVDLPANKSYDLIITDPPYYQAVSYADLSDFSYSWLRGIIPIKSKEFDQPLTEKTGEFVQHIRSDKSKEDEKIKYENQMSLAFSKAREKLSEDGRFVCVFAHKEPDAWETLVKAIISAGFVVTGSWPIQTEMPSRQRGAGVAALASSIWLICRPRKLLARPGWDNRVMEEMRSNISERLRDYWDAGIRGPDFVWAATGPALEAYSKHPVVKKANSQGEILGVGEFLVHVRRMVVDFVVGQVLTGDEEEVDLAAADRMDAPTAYYLLHRNDFGLDEAPSGACILYATACGLSDHALETTWDLLARKGGKNAPVENESDDDDSGSGTSSGSMVKLKPWMQRKHRSMGFEAPGGQPVPLIDRIHRLMHLWKSGDVVKVDEYLDDNGLRRQELFKRLLQSLIELSPAGNEERTLLESLSNHVQAKGATAEDHQAKLFATEITEGTEG